MESVAAKLLIVIFAQQSKHFSKTALFHLLVVRAIATDITDCLPREEKQTIKTHHLINQVNDDRHHKAVLVAAVFHLHLHDRNRNRDPDLAAEANQLIVVVRIPSPKVDHVHQANQSNPMVVRIMCHHNNKNVLDHQIMLADHKVNHVHQVNQRNLMVVKTTYRHNSKTDPDHQVKQIDHKVDHDHRRTRTRRVTVAKITSHLNNNLVRQAKVNQVVAVKATHLVDRHLVHQVNHKIIAKMIMVNKLDNVADPKVAKNAKHHKMTITINRQPMMNANNQDHQTNDREKIPTVRRRTRKLESLVVVLARKAANDRRKKNRLSQSFFCLFIYMCLSDDKVSNFFAAYFIIHFRL